MKKPYLMLLIGLALIQFSLSGVTVYADMSAPVRIAIIDTGISTLSIDSTNIAQGKNYILPAENTMDKVGHGTAIASIIVGSEKAGISGICPDAVLVPLVCYSTAEHGEIVQGDATLLAQIIREAVDIYDCRIINISNGSLSGTKALEEAVAYAEEQGAFLVSSTGNDGNHTVYYPGAYDSVLCVGATNDLQNGPADFSNRNDALDLLAPGEHYSVATIKGGKRLTYGTSFSTAYIAGVAAKLLEIDPELTPAQLRSILCDAANDLGDPGYDTESGWGILNLDAALSSTASLVSLTSSGVGGGGAGSDGAGSGGSVAQESWNNPFTDLLEDSWYYQAVQYVSVRGIMKGTSATTFSLDKPTTRGQIVTILWRMEGSPDTLETEATTYADVGDSSFYGKAVCWASASGVVLGYDDGNFGPKDPITREQMAAILYRYASYKGYDMSSMADMSKYADHSIISPYAMTAIQWATAEGLLNGTSSQTLDPKGLATRAQVAAIFQRL